MSVDEVAVLRAAGLESAAKVIEAARAGQVAAQPPAAPPAAGDPAPAGVPAPAALPPQVQALGAGLAAGTMPGTPPGNELTVDQWESLPQPERLERMDELDRALASEGAPDRPGYGHWKAGR
jgi:hypothetical protein